MAISIDTCLLLAAVMAFKAAYKLETDRRESDKRVLAIYTEMKDMMAVLTQYAFIFTSVNPLINSTAVSD